MAHKQGLLRSYIEGEPSTINYINRYVFLLAALFEHPKFKYDLANQVRDGVGSALIRFYNVLFPPK